MQIVAATMQNSMEVARKIKIGLPYDPAIPSWVYIQGTQSGYQRVISNPMFIAASALFTIVKTWKQPTCLLTDEWIKKMWYIYTMEGYSAEKRTK